MRHHNANRKFGREAGQRLALLRSLERSLILHEKITTTEAKAKEVRPLIEKLVTRAKHGEVSDRRIISARLGNQDEATKKLVDEIAPRYKDRDGGYTRITKIGNRTGLNDGAAMAVIEFV